MTWPCWPSSTATRRPPTGCWPAWNYGYPPGTRRRADPPGPRRSRRARPDPRRPRSRGRAGHRRAARRRGVADQPDPRRRGPHPRDPRRLPRPRRDLPSWNLLEPSYYCTSPAEHGHASRWQLSSPAGTGGSDSGTSSRRERRAAQPDPAQDPGRRLVITGNKAWQAAAEVRHRWLAASLFPRRSVPREAQRVPGPAAAGHARPAPRRPGHRGAQGPVHQRSPATTSASGSRTATPPPPAGSR